MTIFSHLSQYIENYSEYEEFIERYRLPSHIRFETAAHHILPRWKFPEFQKFTEFPENKAILRHEHHYEAHLILARIWPTSQNTLTVRRISKNFEHIRPEEYHEIMKLAAIHVSEINTGKVRSDEFKDNLRVIVSEQHRLESELGISRFTEESLEKFRTRELLKLDTNSHPFQKENYGTLNWEEGRSHWSKMTSNELSAMNSDANNRRVANGTHNFLDSNAATLRAEKRVKNGTHNFQQSDTLTLTNKNGVSSRQSKSILDFWKASGLPMTEWEYVAVTSKESKRRRINGNV